MTDPMTPIFNQLVAEFEARHSIDDNRARLDPPTTPIPPWNGIGEEAT